MRKKYACAVLLIVLFLPYAVNSPSYVTAQDTEKVLKLGVIGDPENLNPVLAWTELSWILLEWMYEPLVRWDVSGGEWKIQPGLAESWEWSEDGTQVTFHLAENATWHDGTPITAHDVNWTLFTMTWMAWWRASTSHIDHENIEVLDNYTIRLNFVMNGYKEGWFWQEDPPYYFWRDWYDNTSVAISKDYFMQSIPYLPILPEHIWDPVTWHDPVYGVNGSFYEPWGFWDYLNWDGIGWGTLDYTWEAPKVGSGPFEFVEWVPGESLTFEAYEDYHYGAPNVDEIEIEIYSTIETMTQAVQSGDIDICETSITFTELSDYGPNVEVVENPFMGFSMLGVNQYEPYLNVSGQYEDRSGGKHNALLEPAVKKAIHQAVNKTKLAEVAYLGTANATDSVIHQALPWHNDDLETYTTGTEAAIATLEDAGWSKNGEDLWQKEIDGINETLDFGLKYTSGIPIDFSLAQLIEEDLEAAGFAITTLPTEATTFVQDLTQSVWNFDLMITFYTQLGDPNYFMSYMRAESYINLNGINITAIEDMFLQQQITADPEERKEIVDEFQQLIYNDSSVIPLCNYMDVEVYRSDRWEFTETDWHSGMIAIPNVDAWRTVDEAPETTTPAAPLPVEMIILAVGVAVVVVVILGAIWIKQR
ncbi:MAG: ABC transporter substrate-binding protein [Candidatus Thorarchaeota archaeon]